MAEGQAVACDVVLRNEPGGPCTGGLGGPTLSGSIALATSRPAGDTISQIAIWLEAPDPAGPRVLPVAGALSTDGGPVAPSGCAGRTAAGCTPSIQATVGNVAYPDGATATVPAGTTVTLPFRYFPILAAEDLDRVAAGPVTLAVAVTSQDGVRIARQTVTFVAAAALGDVQAVAPGDQVDLPGAFAYTTGPADPDTISTRIDATAARPGPVTATPVSITTLVTTDGSQRPGLSPVAWPDAVTAGAASTVTLTVAPTGSVSGPVTVTGGGVTRALVDDGSGADLVGADSVFSGRIDVTAPDPDPVVLTVAADLDGTATTGTVEIEVLPAGAPTGPAPHGPITQVAYDNGFVVNDRIVVHTAEDATFAQVADAAATVAGTVVGRVDATVWQIGILAVQNKVQLDAVLATISGSPGVVGGQPVAVAVADAVVPNDLEFPNQGHLTRVGVDRAWVFSAAPRTGR